MVKVLEQAIAALSELPDDDQEQIGRKLLTHVERIRRLRAELDKGLQSLDAGEGRELDMEQFLASKRSQG
jgi:Arc/MetJ-type ribon-helix-helix transcriptional regulator